MAIGLEKVQRLSGETFPRIRNDHDQFLEAYEKPTQIYRFLKARHNLKPLFLQRNLSYMPRHPRNTQKRFRRKFLRMNNQDRVPWPQGTRKTDIASKIKSDNYLEISFCGLEQGCDYNELMANARGSGTAAATGKKEEPARMTDRSETEYELTHGTPMEVEVLLFQFKQSSIDLSEDSYPYSCSSLGKQVLEYKQSTDKNEWSSQSSRKSNTISVMVPESVLTWKANETSSTQMLVFRASCAAKPLKKPTRFIAPIHLINFVSRKGCRKNVAVSVNRLNLSEMGHTKMGVAVGKQLQPCSDNDCLPVVTKEDVVEDDSFEDGVEEVTDEVEKRFRSGTTVVASSPCGDTSSSLAGGETFQCNGMMATGTRKQLSLEKTQTSSAPFRPSSLHKQPKPLPTFCGKGRTQPSRNHEHLVKKSCKAPKKTTKDASVMTTLSLGTDVIPDMSIFRQSPPPHLAPHDQRHSFPGHDPSDASGNEPYSALFSRSSFSSSAPLRRKGFVDKCTSPKLTFRNIALNGVNGYALPEVAALRSGGGSVPPKRSVSDSVAEPQVLSATTGERGSERKKKNVFKKHSAGMGKQGTRSFLVSVPRVHFDNLMPHRHFHNSETSSLSHSADKTCVQGAMEAVGTTSNDSAKLKRRTEIERLQDTLRPPGQKETELEMPSFSAEGVSDRPSFGCSAVANSHSWLCSSTRKITPVHLFESTFSSSNRTVNSGASPMTVGSCSPLSRKRSESSSDSATLSASLQPPAKLPKIMDDDPPRLMTFLEEKKVKGNKPTAEKNGNTSDVVDDRKHPESMVESEVEGDNDEECPSGQQQQHAPSLISPSEQVVSSSVPKNVYSAELVMFDSRGECLIKEGQYSLLMQNCSKRKESVSMFEPLSWSTVFGGHNDAKKKDVEKVCSNLLLKFTVSWSHGPPQHRLCSDLSTALDLQRIRETYFEAAPPKTTPPSPRPPPSPPCSPPLILCKAPDPLPSTITETDTDSSNESVKGSTAAAEPVTLKEEELEQEEFQHVCHSPSSTSMDLVPCRPSKKIFFHYLYSDNNLQKTESRLDLVCPLCSLSCGRLYSLLKHMSLCHPRFYFTYTPGEGMAHVVDVHVNKLYDVAAASSMDRDPGEWSDIALVRRKKGPLKCLSRSAVFVERHVEVKEDLSEFLNDGSWRRGYKANRVYHHCRTCLPMLPEEIELGSGEESLTLDWQRNASKKMIDDFTDVNEGEKELMTLWNAFAMNNKIIAEKQVSQACLKFAQDNGILLLDRGLVSNFLAHLVHLFEVGLITPSIMKESMGEVFRLEAGVS